MTIKVKVTFKPPFRLSQDHGMTMWEGAQHFMRTAPGTYQRTSLYNTDDPQQAWDLSCDAVRDKCRECGMDPGQIKILSVATSEQ